MSQALEAIRKRHKTKNVLRWQQGSYSSQITEWVNNVWLRREGRIYVPEKIDNPKCQDKEIEIFFF